MGGGVGGDMGEHCAERLWAGQEEWQFKTTNSQTTTQSKPAPSLSPSLSLTHTYTHTHTLSHLLKVFSWEQHSMIMVASSISWPAGMPCSSGGGGVSWKVHIMVCLSIYCSFNNMVSYSKFVLVDKTIFNRTLLKRNFSIEIYLQFWGIFTFKVRHIKWAKS